MVGWFSPPSASPSSCLFISLKQQGRNAINAGEMTAPGSRLPGTNVSGTGRPSVNEQPSIIFGGPFQLIFIRRTLGLIFCRRLHKMPIARTGSAKIRGDPASIIPNPARESCFMSDIIVLTVIFCIGACIGSFLNVCIWRVPRSESIVRPGSRCPRCRTAIRFYDNIPIISYLVLLGKCRHCAAPIPLRYPLVEGLTGLLAAAAAWRFGVTVDFLIYFGFIAALVTVTFIDVDLQIIPDVISLPGIPIGLAASLLSTRVTFTDSLIGIFLGGGSLFLVAWGYYQFTGKEGMGGGDIKLLAMIGAFIGWQGVFFTIFISSAVGSTAGAILMLFAKKDLKFAVAFGPFLALGALAYLFAGPELIDWYYHSAFR